MISTDALGPDAPHFVLGAPHNVTLGAGAGHEKRCIAAHPVIGLVAGRHQSGGSIGAAAHPMVGREAELAHANVWLRQSAAHAPIFFVRAEAGGGKSRLLGAISDLARGTGLRVVHSQCEEEYLAAPLQPISQITHKLGHYVRPSADLWATQEAMKSMIVNSARYGPLMMVIDDWQRADDATKRVVEQILIEARGDIRVLVASRTDNPGLQGRKPERTIGLPPLTPSAVESMISARAPELDAQIARKIQMVSGGNPLLIEELCRDPEFNQTDSSNSKVSFRVAAVVERRVATLPPEVINWLEHIAV